MSHKSRTAYTTGGHCLRECVNKGSDICDKCFKFSLWEIPATCTLLSLKHKAERDKNWKAYSRIAYIIDKYGPYKQVLKKDAMEIVTVNEEGQDVGKNKSVRKTDSKP